MKFVLVAVLALIAAVSAGPVQLTDNNMGDIVSVGVNLEADITSNIDQNIVSVIVALLNNQEIDVDLLDQVKTGGKPAADNKLQITPEMIQKFQQLMSKH